MQEIHIKPSWPLESSVATGATAPEYPLLPTDETAAELIEPVADDDPDGALTQTVYNVCNGEECCVSMIDDGPDECENDTQCPGYPACE